jgi:hypothetical protein
VAVSESRTESLKAVEIMDDLLDALARLNARVESLERKIAALESASQAQPSDKIEALNFPATAQSNTDLVAPEAGSAFPVFGKAMLGIAGAYLLRAVAESGSFPKLAVVVLALAYAATWLVWAVRVSLDATLARIVYAATSALILTPMLWELCLRFQFLSSSFTAALLTAFVVVATGLAWKRKLDSIMWVAVASAVLSTVGLLIAAHDPVPFVSALLVIATAIEIAASRDRAPALRPLVALACNLAICTMLYIYSSPESARDSYPSVGAGTLVLLAAAFFLIYGTSVSLRAALLQRRFTFFEVFQTVFAFAAAIYSVLHFGGANRVSIVGYGCILLSAATYAATFLFFDRLSERRNYHVCATWSLVLFLAGTFFNLAPSYLALCLSAMAILATIVGCRAGRLVLEFHGLVYLAAAAFASGLLNYAGLALAGTFPSAPGVLVWSVAAAAVICYGIGGCYRGVQWPYRLLELLSAILAVSAALTFLVSVLVWVAAIGMVLSPSHVAVIRTLITCAVALALSFSGSRWQRIELMWIAYGMVALVTAKLLFEDMRHGEPALIAISIFLYAIALIMIPRAARWGGRPSKKSEAVMPDALANAAGK